MKRISTILIGYFLTVSSIAQPLLLSMEELGELPEFTVIEDAMYKPDIVYMLNLRSQGIVTLPDNIAELANLQIIDLSYNTELELEQAIGSLSKNKSLQVLILDGVQIEKLPESISSLENLKVLGLDYNPDILLPDLFNTICNMKRLGYLFLAQNQITSLPAEIGKLNNLEYLYLNENELTDLPDEIKFLTNLEILNLNGNNIPKSKTRMLQTELPNAMVMD